MKELLRTNDVVLLSYATALLRDEGLAPIVLDTHTSILEGSVGAIPRRLMVADAEYDSARVLLDGALDGVAAEGAAPQGRDKP